MTESLRDDSFLFNLNTCTTSASMRLNSNPAILRPSRTTETYTRSSFWGAINIPKAFSGFLEVCLKCGVGSRRAGSFTRTFYALRQASTR